MTDEKTLVIEVVNVVMVPMALVADDVIDDSVFVICISLVLSDVSCDTVGPRVVSRVGVNELTTFVTDDRPPAAFVIPESSPSMPDNPPTLDSRPPTGLASPVSCVTPLNKPPLDPSSSSEPPLSKPPSRSPAID